MSEVKSNHLAASNILVESIKLIFTIATVYMGGFFTLAIGTSRDWSYWLAIVVLTLTAILSIWAINMIVNRIWDACEENIMAKSVRHFFTISVVLLFSGIGISLYHIQKINSHTDNASPPKNASYTRITENEVTISDSINAKIKIDKASGGITSITINDHCESNFEKAANKP